MNLIRQEIRAIRTKEAAELAKHFECSVLLPREGHYADATPSVEEYKALKTRKVDLHPVALMPNARTDSGGKVVVIPDRAVTVGPLEKHGSQKRTEPAALICFGFFIKGLHP